MSFIFGFLMVAVNVAVCLKNINKGLLLYLVLAFTFPHTHLGGYIISYEILAFVPVFAIFLFKTKKFYFSTVHILMYLYLMLLLISTVISVNLYNTGVLWIFLLATFRFVLALFMLTQLMKNYKDALEKILLAVIGINLCLVLVQMIFPQSVTLFYNLYFRESTAALRVYLEMGFLPRATGSFDSPNNLSVISLLAFAYFYAQLLAANYKKTVIFGCVAALICGILTLTKTFVLGVPLVVIAGLIFKILFSAKRRIVINTKKVFTFTAVMTLIAAIGYVTIQIAIEKGFGIIWYLQFLTKPLEAFVTRHDLQEGSLVAAKEVIYNNLLIGVGKTQPLGEFLGDSLYVVLLHNTGILGAILFITTITLLAFKAFSNKSLPALMVLFALLLGGFAMPTFISLTGAMVVAYVAVQPLKISKTFTRPDRVANNIQNQKMLIPSTGNTGVRGGGS
ncbi:hypothetical protein M1N11_04245 [Peptococcaceae bacterium]|nr:hypothetical protein [Peptococcaceae bacterium]